MQPHGHSQASAASALLSRGFEAPFCTVFLSEVVLVRKFHYSGFQQYLIRLSTQSLSIYIRSRYEMTFSHGSSWSVPALLMSLMVLLVVCPAPISASHPKRPHRFTVYVHETRGVDQNSTLRVVTNSTLGVVSVLTQPLREGILPTSKLIGKQSGLVSMLGFTGEALYGAFDFHIQSDHYNGTFLVQGSQNLNLPVRTLAIVGGTGDFYLARGYATIKTVGATATTAGYLNDDENGGVIQCCWGYALVRGTNEPFSPY